ncbi:MAG: DUF424 family protein [Candidatus Aenigmarchaeota archaeon]|nr:DUF424 family protein [Candidatus Aenigmarchaeota archaeon]
MKNSSSPKFCFRIHEAGSDRILAICDASVLGLLLEEGELRLEVSRNFYSGSGCDEKGALELLESSTIVNAVGEGIISLMLKNRLVEESNVLRISGVPHAQLISIG